MVVKNPARFSGVSAMPMNASSRAVSPSTGQITLTRILSGPSSTAMALDKVFTAPFEPLYQTSPGRGRMPPVEPILMITPWPAALISGTTLCVM